MHPSRGDSKPCSVGDCTGTMQFGRRSQHESHRGGAPQAPATAASDEPGWNCSREPAHFRDPAQGDGTRVVQPAPSNE